ncbi:MAG TPA: histidine kinase [Acidimicrobiia bacterium]|nr:histidine kinase [Acidimicrobiia bacterium]
MSAIAHRADEATTTGASARAPWTVFGSIAVVAVLVALVSGIAGARTRDSSPAYTALTLLSTWTLVTLVVGFRRRSVPLSVWLAGATATGAAALVSDRVIGLVPVVLAALWTTLPTGEITGRRRRSTRLFLGAVLLLGAPFAIAQAATDGLHAEMFIVESAVLSAVALTAFVARCRDASAIDRARLQWAGWGVVVAGGIACVVALMHLLVGWPDGMAVPIAMGTLFVPFAIALSSFESTVLRIDRLLVRTIETGGLVVLVGAVYVVVVLGFGETPTDTTRRMLGLSLLAAAIAALCFIPARNRLEEIANRRVYGDRRAPDEPLQTFGARMSRAIPLDELLLQLAESLKMSMTLAAAEVWTGTEGVLERAAAVPYRDPTTIRLAEKETEVVARAHVQGNAWLQVWLPGLVEQHRERILRVAPLVHSGELLGVVVCVRTTDQPPFTEEEERVLTELARQVALALHNSALDTALQASLDDLRVANEELRASRARIVATADQSRRQIERNLHDGAQQHLVALAVKLGLARQLVEADPAAVATLLEELRADAQATLTELRELAHGIYPPLLMDRGLPEALRAAANRCVLPTDVVADVGRFPPDAEAAVYFCCLEALQNAGKHAGEHARITVTVTADDDTLSFSVVDDGAGFDSKSDAIRGHGFVNMADRLGAIGGKIGVESAPGSGTAIRGAIPLEVDSGVTP